MRLPRNCPHCKTTLAVRQVIDTGSGRVLSRSVSCDKKGCGFSRSDKELEPGSA